MGREHAAIVLNRMNVSIVWAEKLIRETNCHLDVIPRCPGCNPSSLARVWVDEICMPPGFPDRGHKPTSPQSLAVPSPYWQKINYMCKQYSFESVTRQHARFGTSVPPSDMPSDRAYTTGRMRGYETCVLLARESRTSQSRGGWADSLNTQCLSDQTDKVKNLVNNRHERRRHLVNEKTAEPSARPITVEGQSVGKTADR